MDLLSTPILAEYESRFVSRAEAGLDQEESEIALYPEYKWRPFDFAREVIGVDLWICQQELCQAVVDHAQVSVRACYASGKTFLAAVLALWWLYTRETCLVVSTAPTARQVEELLWAEIADLHASSKRPLGGQILNRKARLDGKRKAYGVAGDAKNKSTKAGYHSKSGQVLFLVDEAAGMTAAKLDGFRGLLVNEDECRSLEIGNPVSTEGPFYEDHTRPKGDKFLYAISALRTPSLTGEGEEKKRYPGLISQAYVDKLRRLLGEAHPIFRTTVLAEFVADEHGQQVIPSSWVTLAQQRWAEPLQGAEDVADLAADVAGPGQNETVLYFRKGRRIYKVAAWVGRDIAEIDSHGEKGTQITARRIVEYAEQLGAKRLFVDSQGLGIGITDRIEGLIYEGRAKGCKFYPVPTGESAIGPTAGRYHRLVDQIYWNAREAFDPGNPLACAIDPEDSDLADQLPMRRWSIVGDGEDSPKIKVTRKRDLAFSPDCSDSVSLLFFEPEEEGEVFFV